MMLTFGLMLVISSFLLQVLLPPALDLHTERDQPDDDFTENKEDLEHLSSEDQEEIKSAS